MKLLNLVVVFSLLLLASCTKKPGGTVLSDCRTVSNSCSPGFQCTRQADGEYLCVEGMAANDAGVAPADCRALGCDDGLLCLEVGFDEFACQPDNSCIQNNGGCGDSEFVGCVPAAGGGVECVDIRECEDDNGFCGDPSAFFCVENHAGPPECIPLTQATAPDLAGVYFQALTYRRDGVKRHCVVVWLPRSQGLADTVGGCEDCSFAWNLNFERADSTCPQDLNDSFPETFSFFPLAVDYGVDGILGQDGGVWGMFELEGSYVASNSAGMVWSDPDDAHIDLNGNGEVEPGEAEVLHRTTMVGLVWSAFDVTCGDGYCDFMEYGCDLDCPDDQQPASGFLMQAVAYQPQDAEFRDCFRLDRMSMVSGEQPGGCDACIDTWLGETEVMATNCGARERAVGGIGRSSIGATGGDEFVVFSSSQGDWVRLTGEHGYYADLRTLMSMGSFTGFGDRDGDGENDEEDPLRVRWRNFLIHY